MSLLTFTNKGIYCSQADVYIDPWRKVPKALITHGHSDHARSGHKSYLCTHDTLPVLKLRLGRNLPASGIGYGERVTINGVSFSFHPAGHVIGSAQIRAEYKGEVWVVSGDYKIENDGISGGFEPVLCQHFITECTFGLPIYKWDPQHITFDQINNWWRINAESGITSMISAYSLGKAQRVIENLEHSIGPIYTHPAVESTNKAFRDYGIPIKPTTVLSNKVSSSGLKKALVISPSGNASDDWFRKAKEVKIARATGWMVNRSRRNNGSFDQGFVLSDHADWDGIINTIKATGAENIYPTHGYTLSLNRWLNENGYNSRIVETEYESESNTAP